MRDGWEVLYGMDPLDASDNYGDLDGDQLFNLHEYNNSLVDSIWWDVDGILSTRPDLHDTDDDGLDDNSELYVWFTDPTFNDTDFDGMPDGWEVQYGLDPRDPSDAQGDLDGDGHDYDRALGITPDEYFTNLQEYLSNTDPTDNDTDDDGMFDGWESSFGLDPLDLAAQLAAVRRPDGFHAAPRGPWFIRLAPILFYCAGLKGGCSRWAIPTSHLRLPVERQPFPTTRIL